MAYTVRYGFSQRFRVPATEAFRWLVDYDSEDLSRMGEQGGRMVKRISDNSFLLTDFIKGRNGKIAKKDKLVHIYPERLFWSSVHLAGSSKNSQFLYQIVKEGRNSSRIDFTGFQVIDGGAPSPREINRRAKELTKEDSAAWKLLARELENDFGVRKQES